MSRLRFTSILFALLSILLMVFPAVAQFDEEPVDPNANITYPLPVDVVHGTIDITGSASVSGLNRYFIQARPIIDLRAYYTGDETELVEVDDLEDLYVPLSLPVTTPVTEGVLAQLDTTLLPDGVYEFRLTIEVTGEEPILVTVAPVRIDNERVPEATPVPVIPTPEPLVPTQAPPTPIPTEDPTPRATVTTINANVRAGDGTNYGIVANLSQGDSVQIIGVSAYNTGWYQVRLSGGQVGWMAPSIVSVSGNVGGVPRVVPPPPPATPTFTPVPFTPTPVTQANLVAGIVVLNPATPVCNQAISIGFDVANLGSQATTASGTVSLTDTHVASGTVTSTTVGGFPIIQPGQTVRVDMFLTVSTYYNEGHRLTLQIDAANLIPETTNDDNTRTVEYVLSQGSC